MEQYVKNKKDFDYFYRSFYVSDRCAYLANHRYFNLAANKLPLPSTRTAYVDAVISNFEFEGLERARPLWRFINYYLFD